jgi:hypothetical protein
LVVLKPHRFTHTKNIPACRKEGQTAASAQACRALRFRDATFLMHLFNG